MSDDIVDSPNWLIARRKARLREILWDMAQHGPGVGSVDEMVEWLIERGVTVVPARSGATPQGET